MPGEMSLDDSSYDRLYEKAMERLDGQAPWWTHREISDPGIMLIETWALLSDMQSYYLDQVQESHYRKYLKLLGISPDEGKCAWTWVFFEFEKGAERECVVPRGTKLLSDQMVFETEEEVRLIRNRLQEFFLGNHAEDRVDAMRLSRKNRFALEDQAGQERVLFRFTLDGSLKQEEFSFFVLLDERVRRNGVGEGACMVGLVWEYWRGDNWQKAEVVRDDTGGLLFSGIITLRFALPEDGRGHGIKKIRCRIGQGAYEIMPVLYKIYLNVVRVVQRDTLCCEEDAVFTPQCHRIALKGYLARTGRLRILKKAEEAEEEGAKEKAGAEEKEGAEEDGKLWEDITERVCVDAPVTAECRERYVSYEGTGRVKILCAASRTVPQEFLFPVTGIAAQRIELPWKSLMRSSVRLMVRQEGEPGERYRFCVSTDPEEDRYRNAWHWDGEENVIVLGDGRHGEIPSPSEDGLCLSSLALWEGERGNVPVDRITKWQQPELFSGILCTNFLAGREGRSRKMPSVRFGEAREALLRQNRMVTEDDIRELALETPGLMISRVTAGWRDHTVVVEVYPAYPLKERHCTEWYRKQVERHLMPYRLAGTKIRVEIIDRR